MLRRPKVLLNAVWLTITLTACSSLNQPLPQPTNTQSQEASRPTESVPSASSTDRITWQSILTTTPAPAGWIVQPCTGEAPFLCINADGQFLGGVELSVYDLETLPDFQTMLEAANVTEPTNRQRTEQPEQQTKIRAALRAWVDNHYAVIKADRQAAYGNQVRFSSLPPEDVSIGRLQGLRYEFIGTTQNGEIREHQLGYVAFDGQQLYLITTALDPQTEGGGIQTEEALQQFKPYLTEIVANLRLPLDQR